MSAMAGLGCSTLRGYSRNSVDRDQDLECLLKAQLLFWMLAATDGHAKNFSIRILSQGRFQLTPLYDVLSIWPIMGEGPNKISWHNARLAMSVRGKNKHYLLKDIQRRHFNDMAAQCGLGEHRRATDQGHSRRDAGRHRFSPEESAEGISAACARCDPERSVEIREAA